LTRPKTTFLPPGTHPAVSGWGTFPMLIALI